MMPCVVAVFVLLACFLPLRPGRSRPGPSPATSGATRSKAKTRLVLHVNPVGKLGAGIRGSRVAAVVLVVDLESQATIDPDLVRVAMGLTPAQSRVAAMVAEGRTLREIAAATGRKEETVRWHLRQIFRRQGISRRTELVRRVLSLDGLSATDRRSL